MSGQPASRFTSADASPGLLLWRVTLAWQRAMRTALAPHDLTHVQFVLLAATWWLQEHGGPATQQQLADHAGTDPMMTSQVVRRLADRGLLTREADPTDARARRLRLTKDGARVLRGALADVEAADATYFAPLPDIDGFVQGLHALSAPPESG